MPKINLSSNEWLGIVVSSKNNYYIIRSGFAYYYISNSNNTYEVFDIVKIQGNLKDYFFYTYESQFDFNEFLRNSLIFKEIEAENVTNVFLTPIRNKVLISNYLYLYNENAKSILSKLLFNTSYSLEYNDLVYNNNLFYLLSCSSLHIYFFNRIIKKLLLVKIREKSVDLIIITLNLGLLFISNYKISIIRIFILSIINFYYNHYSKKKVTFIYKISLTFIITIILIPKFSLSNGLIYSLVIPLVLYVSREAFSTVSMGKRKYLRLLMIFLLILPLNIYYQSKFSLLNMPLTILLSPLIGIYYLLGIFGLFLPITHLINLLGNLIMNILLFINNISFEIYVGKVNFFFVILFYLLIFFMIYSLEIKRKTHVIVSLNLMVLLTLISSLPIKNQFTSEVCFINVGQGDSCLVRDKNTTVLIDTGGIVDLDLANKTLIPFLRKKRITKLDFVFITHEDYDHSGAFNNLKANFKVLNYNSTNDFTNIKIGNINFTNLNPSSKKEENEDSLVLYFKIGDKYFLNMGDAPSEIEEKIINNYPNLKVDYLKVGHHGSKTSTSDSFISKIKPKEAIISSGKNYYGHPSSQVLNILTKYSVKIRRTDLEGTICY